MQFMEEKNTYDRTIEQLKNNPWVAITLIVFICFAAILNMLVDFNSLSETEENSQKPFVYNDNRTYTDNSKTPIVNKHNNNRGQNDNSDKTSIRVQNAVRDEISNKQSQPNEEIKSTVYKFPFQVDNKVKKHFRLKHNIIIEYAENEHMKLNSDNLIEKIPNSNRYRLIGGYPLIILNSKKCGSTILLKPNYYYGLPKPILIEKIRKEYIDSLSQDSKLFIKEIEQCIKN